MEELDLQECAEDKFILRFISRWKLSARFRILSIGKSSFVVTWPFVSKPVYAKYNSEGTMDKVKAPLKRIDRCCLSREISRQFARIWPALFLGASQIFSASFCLCSPVSAASPGSAQERERADSSVSHSASAQAETQPRCQIIGTLEIAITCDYTPMPANSAQTTGMPQIALNRAALSFKTKDDNWMRLELRLTKLDSTPISQTRPVYIEVDDDAGHNFIRRPLPNVKLAALAPGQSVDFHEQILVPALRPGHYQITLWIPSTDPQFKFSSTHNLLISSVGVADEKSGLNKVAAFSVTR